MGKHLVEAAVYLVFIFGVLNLYAQDNSKKEVPKSAVVEAKEKEPVVKIEEIKVKWYRPEVRPSPNQNKTLVILSGKTIPGFKVYLFKKKIVSFDDKKKVEFIKRKDLVIGKKVGTANEKGYFSLELELPQKNVQLPVKVRSPKSKKHSKKYQVNLNVGARGVQVKDKEVLAASPFLRSRYRVWGGLGYNYLVYKQQTGAPVNGDLEFGSFKGPSYFGKVSMWLGETWDLGLTAKVSPGEVSSSDDITITSGSYNWLTFAFEGTKYPESWKYKLLDRYDSELGYRIGVQYHSVPFIARTGEGNNIAEIENNTLTMMTAGLHYVVFKDYQWSYEMFMRYQYPLSSGDVFEISPSFAFDGSLGIMYKYKPKFIIGAFWYGQWHQYDFSHFDKQDSAIVDGSQTLFFSNIEIRLGWEF